MSYENNPGLDDLNTDEFGNPFASPHQYVTKGQIYAVNPHTLTCDVMTERGYRFRGLALPHLSHDPEGGGGSIRVPRVGQLVAVQCGLGGEYITQILAEPSSVVTDPDLTFHVTEADTDSFISHSDVSNYRGYLPKDLLPGDWLEMGNQGQYFALLDGGASILHATPFAQVRALQHDDTLQLMGRNLEIFTGFGNIKFEDQDGKKAVIFEGGTDQWSELKPGEEKYSIRALIGGDAEGLIDFRVQDKRGQPVLKSIIEADGSTRNEYSGSRLLTIDGNIGEDIGGRRVIDIGNLDALTVHGNQEIDIEGSQSTNVSQALNTIVGQDRTDMVNRDWNLSAGRFMRLAAGGDPLLGKPGDAAVDWTITNGSLVIDIGNPAALDTQKSLSGFNLKTYLGNIVLESLVKGNIQLNTMNPLDSVILGGTIGGVAPFHALLWEPFKLLIEALGDYVDRHNHVGSMGTTSPALMSGTPLRFRSMLSRMIEPTKSRKVKIGV